MFATEPIVKLYKRLFITRREPVLIANRRGWYSAKRSLKWKDLQLAIAGEITLGMYAVSDKGNSIWCAIDVDTEEGFKGLVSMTATMGDQRNLILEKSRRGGHLIICTVPTPWDEVAAYGKYLVSRYTLGEVEVFPKGAGLNGLRLPGTKHHKTNQAYPFLDPLTGKEILDKETYLRQIVPVPLPRVHLKEAPKQPFGNTEQFEGLTHADLLAEVSRHTTLTRIEIPGAPPDRYRGRCPLAGHADRNNSFGVDGRFWRCFSGCRGEERSNGNLADFRREMGL